MFAIRSIVAPGGGGGEACLAIGLTLAVLVAQFANISGGIFNPVSSTCGLLPPPRQEGRGLTEKKAVAVALFLRGKLGVMKLVASAAAEMGGGLVGGMLAVYLNRADTPAPVCPGAGAGYSNWDVALAEVGACDRRRREGPRD